MPGLSGYFDGFFGRRSLHEHHEWTSPLHPLAAGALPLPPLAGSLPSALAASHVFPQRLRGHHSRHLAEMHDLHRNPFLPMWSLGVEEQFYFLFPWVGLGLEA